MATDEGRLATGGCIDRSRPVGFRFNGKRYEGYDGDSLASALLANGVCLTARSFKYHRPRGIVGAGVEEPASFVELLGSGQSGSQPITTVRLTEGLDARSVNCWPSPEIDVMSVNQAFSRLLPAGFYYKTFKWPGWRLFEPIVRRAAGLASAPVEQPRQGRYETRHWHCDVLVAGAGAAGLMAALTAARCGARVLIADEGVGAGGRLLDLNDLIDGRPAREWIDAATAELAGLPTVTHLQNATVWAYREHNLLLVTERCPNQDHVFQRTWRIRAGQVVIATGAVERTLVFADNDRPGVMLASAVSAYVNRYAVRPGKRAVVFTNNSSAYRTAADLIGAGMEVAAVVDSRAAVGESVCAAVPGIEILAGHVVVGTHGRKRVRGVTVKSLKDGSERVLGCDLVSVSGGWSPVIHLFSQSRGTLRYGPRLAAFVADVPAQDALCTGGCAGMFGLRDALRDGAAKGQAAARAQGFGIVPLDMPRVVDEPAYEIEPLWHVDGLASAGKAFVDMQNDVTLDDVHLAIREGFAAVEHVKRYTTAGMGLDQGKTGNINVVGAIAGHTGASLESVGTTTFRPPYVPIEFGAIAGLREESVFLPFRHTPITRWNVDRGAVMYEAGARWRRPGYYPNPGESFQDSVSRECLAARNGVAVYDGSPLGKFEIKGPDALKLIEMLYTNSFADLEFGSGKYGLMLSDDGLILDDGVTFRLGEHHYLMSTSTAHADDVNRHMEHFLQIERPAWKAMITPVTSQWANATLCGPKAREVLHALGTDIDLSSSAFPFMTIRRGVVAGFPARVCRVSFTGELSFEINVFSRHALALWEKILDVGAGFGLTPIGSEANHVLRVEKGFLSLGHEVDGTVDARDLGMGWIMSKKKRDYIGKRAVEIRRAAGKPRRELVGLLPDDPGRMIPEGAPITPGGRRESSEGFVTACVWSVVRNRSIALALVVNGKQRKGCRAYIRLKNEVVPAEITEPCFHDPEGRLSRS